MAKKSAETTVLSTLQDMLIFQMANAGVPQADIRKAIGVRIDRVNRIAKLAKNGRRGNEK